MQARGQLLPFERIVAAVLRADQHAADKFAFGQGFAGIGFVRQRQKQCERVDCLLVVGETSAQSELIPDREDFTHRRMLSGGAGYIVLVQLKPRRTERIGQRVERERRREVVAADIDASPF